MKTRTTTFHNHGEFRRAAARCMNAVGAEDARSKGALGDAALNRMKAA
jgi:hypothetical protein